MPPYSDYNTTALLVEMGLVPVTPRQAIALQILSAISRDQIVEFIYRDQDGVISLRHARPSIIKACQTKKTRGVLFMEAFDVQRNAMRRFRLENIREILGVSPCTGSVIGGAVPHVSHDGDTCPVHES